VGNTCINGTVGVTVTGRSVGATVGGDGDKGRTVRAGGRGGFGDSNTGAGVGELPPRAKS
jgi:hypothetical protein